MPEVTEPGRIKPSFACCRLLPSEVRRGFGSGAGGLVLATHPLWPPGTLFLWMFWPSFNSALLPIPHERKNGVFNTYYALAVSAVTAIALSALAHPQGKISMVRKGAASWPHTHVHVPPPTPALAPGFGWRNLVGCVLEPKGEQQLVKRALGLWRLHSADRLTRGSDLVQQHQTDPGLNLLPASYKSQLPGAS